MRLSNLIFSLRAPTLLTILIFAMVPNAANAATNGAPNTAENTVPSMPPRSGFNFEIGVGYVQWNEDMDLTRANVSTSGFANYAGPALTLDVNRSAAYLNYGAAISVAGGKAVSGGFGAGVTFPDGIDRIWYGTLLQPYIYYRVNPQFLLGLGAMARYRTIDWGSSDPSLKVDSESEATLTASLNLKLLLTERVSFLQSYAPVGTKGRSQWQWNLQYVF